MVEVPHFQAIRLAFALSCALSLAASAQSPSVESGTPAKGLSRLAFGSCAKEDRPQPIWEQILASAPEAWIWAGDNIYGDTEDMSVMRAKYARLAAVPGWQALQQMGIPILATWDDHDYGVNDGGRDYPRRKESQAEFLDFFGVPKDSPRRAREGVYHAETFGEKGRRVQVILLDTRYHRSPLLKFRNQDRRSSAYRPNPDRQATMLGAAQWDWLRARLLEPAELRIIVSSIQFVAAEHRFEKWANLPTERQKMLALIEETKAEGLLFVSGDRHHAELSVLEPKGLYPLYDLTASGINMSNAPREDRPQTVPEPNQHRIGRVYRGPHFGLLTVDWEREDPTITMAIVDGKGERPIEKSIPLSSLKRGTNKPLRFQAPPRRLATKDKPTVTRSAERASVNVRFDGDLSEWPQNESIRLVGRTLYGCFRTPEVRSLSTGPDAIRIALHLDGDQRSGSRQPWAQGAEVLVTYFDQREGRRSTSWRPDVWTYDSEGRESKSRADAIGFSITPSHASDRFEYSFDLDSPILRELARGHEERLSVQVMLMNEAGEAVKHHTQEVLFEGAKRSASSELTVLIPTKDEQSLRILSWNVLWGKPQEEPAAFARILKALQPDILLLQEWDRMRYSEAELCAWFREHVDAEVDWQAMVTGIGDFGQGTAVVSRHPISSRAPAHLPAESGRFDFPVRLAAAVIQTPRGSVLAASVHLKSSGPKGSEEDERRRVEAAILNAHLAGMAAVARPSVVVLGGDFNLVGGAEIIAPALQHLDLDGSALSLADAEQLGAPGQFATHGRSAPFSRLDYLAYSDASADLQAAFVLDTTQLPPKTLEAHGLLPMDSRASDHYPLVIDLRPILPL